MVVLKCRCLNVTLHLAKPPVPVKVTESIGWSDAEDGTLRVGMGTLGLGGHSVEQSALVTELRSGHWKVVYCDNCNMAVFAQSDNNLTECLVNLDCLNPDQAATLSHSEHFSPAYHFILIGSEQAAKLETHKHSELAVNADTRRVIENLRKQGADALERERQKMELRISEHTRQQREQYESVREKMHADANFLATKVVQAYLHREGVKPKASTPTLSPMMGTPPAPMSAPLPSISRVDTPIRALATPQMSTPTSASAQIPSSQRFTAVPEMTSIIAANAAPLPRAASTSPGATSALSGISEGMPRAASTMDLTAVQQRASPLGIPRTSSSGKYQTAPQPLARVSALKLNALPPSQAQTSVFVFDDEDLPDEPPLSDDERELPTFDTTLPGKGRLKALESVDHDLAAMAASAEEESMVDDSALLGKSLPVSVPMRSVWHEREVPAKLVPPHTMTESLDEDFMLSQSVPEKQRRATFGGLMV